MKLKQFAMLAAIGALFIFGAPTLSGCTGGQQVSGAPIPAKLLPPDIDLPSDARVAPPAKNVPKDAAAFSGAWTGSWGGKLSGVLVVQSVEPAGKASVIYAWGNEADDNTHAGYLYITGAIDKGVLHVITRYGDVTYKIQSDGTLAGSYLNGQGYRTAGTFRKVKL